MTGIGRKDPGTSRSISTCRVNCQGGKLVNMESGEIEGGIAIAALLFRCSSCTQAKGHRPVVTEERKELIRTADAPVRGVHEEDHLCAPSAACKKDFLNVVSPRVREVFVFVATLTRFRCGDSHPTKVENISRSRGCAKTNIRTSSRTSSGPVAEEAFESCRSCQSTPPSVRWYPSRIWRTRANHFVFVRPTRLVMCFRRKNPPRWAVAFVVHQVGLKHPAPPTSGCDNYQRPFIVPWVLQVWALACAERKLKIAPSSNGVQTNEDVMNLDVI